MHRRVLQFGIPLATLALGALIGFGFGRTQGVEWGFRTLAMELGYGLSTHSEIASLIRVGDTDRALDLLDQWIDTNVVAVAPYVDDANPFRGLQLAKVYRKAVPPTGANAGRVTEILSREPDLAPPYMCPVPWGGETKASGLERLAAAGSR